MDESFFDKMKQEQIWYNQLMFKLEGDALKSECTCVENSKQRALCPVCDKEKYQSMKIVQAIGERKRVDLPFLKFTDNGK